MAELSTSRASAQKVRCCCGASRGQSYLGFFHGEVSILADGSEFSIPSHPTPVIFQSFLQAARDMSMKQMQNTTILLCCLSTFNVFNGMFGRYQYLVFAMYSVSELLLPLCKMWDRRKIVELVLEQYGLLIILECRTCRFFFLEWASSQVFF